MNASRELPPLTERCLAEALALTGESMNVRFLSYTTESRLPVSPMLIRLLPAVPTGAAPLGKQTFVVARST